MTTPTVPVSRARVSALALALLAGAAPAAFAQRVLERGSFSGWTNPAAPVVTDTENGDAADNWNTHAATFGGALGPLVLRADGFAREDRDVGNVADNTSVTFSPFTNSFRMARAGTVVAPILLDGEVRLLSPNPGNFCQFTLTETVQLYHKNGVGTFVLVPGGTSTFTLPVVDGQVNAAGTMTFHNTQIARFDNQAADGRDYELRASAVLTANANGGVPGVPGRGGLNTQVAFDFRTQASGYGMSFSVSGEPTNYNGDSRTAVRALAAEAAFGTTGAGAQVGIIEPGRALRTHLAYNTRYTVLNGAVGEGDADEHATAVTGIIGADQGAGDQRSGVARGATLTGAASADNGGRMNAAANLVARWGAGNPGVINYSAADAVNNGANNAALDQFLTTNTNVTWVSAAGNEQLDTPGVIGSPNFAFNNIAAGALDSSFSMPADFSSTSGGAFPSKPDLMAPGEYVLAASVRDINNDASLRDYTRSFLGANYNRGANANAAGPVNGTSFAAPHVTGAVALLHGYAASHAADYDAWSRDHRVMKAVLLCGASTSGITDRAGNAWSQAGKTGTGAQGDPAINVPRSLDANLGAGALDCYQATKVYASGEIRRAPQNALQNFVISGPTPNPNNYQSIVATGRSTFWDFERVAQKNGVLNGTVDYILGSNAVLHNVIETGNWQGNVTPNFGFLRSCLSWDVTTNAGGTAYNANSNLELRLYLDGLQDGNVNGFDPLNPTSDILIATTANGAENTKLLDIADTSNWSYVVGFGSVPPLIWNPKFYLEVINLSNAGGPVDYGVAVMIPAPGGLGLLLAAGLAARRRRRA